jgi:hypothetical protein
MDDKYFDPLRSAELSQADEIHDPSEVWPFPQLSLKDCEQRRPLQVLG